MVGCTGAPVAPEQAPPASSAAVKLGDSAASPIVDKDNSQQDKVVGSIAQIKSVAPVNLVDTAAPSRAKTVQVKQVEVVKPQQSGADKQISVAREDMPPSNPAVVWLQLAELALGKDRLTTPAADNAYALYSRVLLEDPDNTKALEGLERIVQRYLLLATSSHNKGRYKQSQLFLQRASKVVPGHKDIASLNRQLNAAAAKQAAKEPAKVASQAGKSVHYQALQTITQSVLKAPAGMQRQRILIPVDALKQQASVLANYLQALARQIEAVDGRLYIIAPRDKQVRWVYGVLNSANPDYRIRANIKHRAPAAIEVTYKAEKPLLDVFH